MHSICIAYSDPLQCTDVSADQTQPCVGGGNVGLVFIIINVLIFWHVETDSPAGRWGLRFGQRIQTTIYGFAWQLATFCIRNERAGLLCRGRRTIRTTNFVARGTKVPPIRRCDGLAKLGGRGGSAVSTGGNLASGACCLAEARCGVGNFRILPVFLGVLVCAGWSVLYVF